MHLWREAREKLSLLSSEREEKDERPINFLASVYSEKFEVAVTPDILRAYATGWQNKFFKESRFMRRFYSDIVGCSYKFRPLII